MNVNAFTDNITLHVKNLTIPFDQIKLYELPVNKTVNDIIQKPDEFADDEKKIRKSEFVIKHDYLIITPVNILSKFRKYAIFIPFHGNLDQSLLGYYRSSYFDKQAGKKMWVSMTPIVCAVFGEEKNCVIARETYRRTFCRRVANSRLS